MARDLDIGIAIRTSTATLVVLDCVVRDLGFHGLILDIAIIANVDAGSTAIRNGIVGDRSLHVIQQAHSVLSVACDRVVTNRSMTVLINTDPPAEVALGIRLIIVDAVVSDCGRRRSIELNTGEDILRDRVVLDRSTPAVEYKDPG